MEGAMKKYKWHGLKVASNGREESIFVGPLPGRKRICLFREVRPGIIEPLAYFQTERKAFEALRIMGLIARGEVQ